MANTSFGEHGGFTVLPRPAMRLRRMDCWIKRDSQLVAEAKTEGDERRLAVGGMQVFASYSRDWNAS